MTLFVSRFGLLFNRIYSYSQMAKTNKLNTNVILINHHPIDSNITELWYWQTYAMHTIQIALEASYVMTFLMITNQLKAFKRDCVKWSNIHLKSVFYKSTTWFYSTQFIYLAFIQQSFTTENEFDHFFCAKHFKYSKFVCFNQSIDFRWWIWYGQVGLRFWFVRAKFVFLHNASNPTECSNFH